jgi:tetratricopeptide (TPR) repeat protein
MKRQTIQEINREIELNPDNPVAYNIRGNIKSSISDYKGAVKDYSRAIELDPGYAEAFYRRGHAKNNMGDKQGALEDLNRAGELGYKQAFEDIREIEGK